MNRKNKILQRILAQGVVAVIRETEPDHVAPLIDGLGRAGITTIEITLTTPRACELIAQYAGREDLLIGAGSVLNVPQAEEVFKAGAQFYASPCYDPEVLAVARQADYPAMPGALTPTEIVHAWRNGADIVKIFPVPSDGPAYLRAVLAPMPGIRLAPSGGVTAENAGEFLRAGAAVLNVGSWLTPAGTTIEERVAETERRGRLLIQALQKTKKEQTS